MRSDDNSCWWKEVLAVAAAILIIAVSVFVVPAAGRYIDQSQPAENLNLGIHADIKHGELSIGVHGEKYPRNANDRPATGIADGHK